VNANSAFSQIRNLWTGLTAWQRISIAVVAVAVAGSLVTFSRWRTERDFRPLFTGMSNEDAGAVVQKLKESATEYRVSDDGSTVLVPSVRVAETRLQLAASGLPRTGRIGFELFDQTKLGTTDFAEQVNFRRALEGELERSIRSVAEVEQARVHITPPKDSVFLESRQPAKASVLLQLRTGARPEQATVTAIAHLVASAVEGLSPDQVSVVDGQGNLLSRPKKSQEPGEVSDELIEYRQKLEKDLLAKANATLEPVLGPGKYRMGLSLDVDFATGEQSEELYDPEKSVMLSSQKSEEGSSGSVTAGVPGTASNLPRPAVRSAGAGGGIVRRTENITYQSSKTVRRLRLPQGNIRRISASLLVDQTLRWENQGGQMQRVLVPPSAENIRALRELVAGAIGLVPSRGDQLVIESLPFDSTLHTAPPAVQKPAPAVPSNAPAPASPLPFGVPGDWRIWAAGASVLLLAGVAFFVLRRRKRRVTATRAPQIAGAARPDEVAAPPVANALAAADDRALADPLHEELERADIERLAQVLRASVEEHPNIAAAVLRAWIQSES
jgi:flagellar M-ring protein FliF